MPRQIRLFLRRFGWLVSCYDFGFQRRSHMTIDLARNRVLHLSRALVPLCLLAPACGGSESSRVADAATDVAAVFDVQPASTATNTGTGPTGTATTTGTSGTATGTIGTATGTGTSGTATATGTTGAGTGTGTSGTATATGTGGAATATGTTAATGDFTVARSQLTRELSPTLAPGDQDAMVEAVNSLGFDLLASAAPPDQNASLSPYSISQALAMAWAGARGTTEDQMSRVLHFSLPQERLHPAFDALDLAITSPSALADQGQFVLTLANSVWADRTFSLLPGYLDTLAVNYGAPVRLVDFINAPQTARLAINQWVGQETAGLIPQLLGPLDISAYTRVVLTNAIYFKAKWNSPFSKNGTAPGTFHLADGTDLTVDTMVQTSNWAYATGTDFQAVELPYLGYDTSMIVVLPATGKLAAVEQALASGGFASLRSSLASSQVYLLLPKFQIDTRFSLGKTLADLGMDKPMCSNLAGDYDFSGMSSDPWLCISDVIHQSNVLVDEVGTEAAAATAVVMAVDGGISGDAGKPIEMRVDRPFLFFIHNRATGAILFMGRVANPKP
jgi:serpin B